MVPMLGRIGIQLNKDASNQGDAGFFYGSGVDCDFTPTLVIEMGCAETLAQLRNNARLWIEAQETAFKVSLDVSFRCTLVMLTGVRPGQSCCCAWIPMSLAGHHHSSPLNSGGRIRPTPPVSRSPCATAALPGTRRCPRLPSLCEFPTSFTTRRPWIPPSAPFFRSRSNLMQGFLLRFFPKPR
jgi:hypothetical protein